MQNGLKDSITVLCHAFHTGCLEMPPREYVTQISASQQPPFYAHSLKTQTQRFMLGPSIRNLKPQFAGQTPNIVQHRFHMAQYYSKMRQQSPILAQCRATRPCNSRFLRSFDSIKQVENSIQDFFRVRKMIKLETQRDTAPDGYVAKTKTKSGCS